MPDSVANPVFAHPLQSPVLTDKIVDHVANLWALFHGNLLILVMATRGIVI